MKDSEVVHSHIVVATVENATRNDDIISTASMCEVQTIDQSNETPSLDTTDTDLSTSSTLEFGDGITALLAELEVNSSQPASSTSDDTFAITGNGEDNDNEDFSNVPIDQLTKRQFAKFMEELKSILTFNPNDFRLNADVKPNS